MDREDEDGMEVPVRSGTPIYERDPTRAWVDPSSESRPKRTVGDRLLALMSDGLYHHVGEMMALLPDGEWARAMRNLLDDGRAFDRILDRYRIRVKLLAERKQSLAELLDGLDTQATLSVIVPEETIETVEIPVTLLRKHMEPEPVLETFDPTRDVDEPVAVEERLHLSVDVDGLSLSAADSSTMTFAILAKRGSGKTYLGMVLAEEFMSSPGLGVPIVIVDPTGAWYGLRSMLDGSPSSLPILILGGEYGDRPLSHTQGAQVAQLVQEMRPRSVILDLSLMAPVEQHEFVADFVLRLYVLNSRPLHMVIDEADEFAPQSLQGSRHQKRCLDEIDRFVRRGRKKGLGSTLISQRSAVVNKNILSQVDGLFLLNMVAPGDLEAVDDWLKLRVAAEQRIECLGQLSNLPPGMAYFTQSGANPMFRRFKVRKRDTFDSGRTPRPNEEIVVPVLAAVEPGTLALVDRHLKEGRPVKEGDEDPDDDSRQTRDLFKGMP
jgi:(2Fe-2S) ferredoxin